MTTNSRLSSPYLTQGRNIPIPKFFYKWTHSPEQTPRTQCTFKIDEFRVGKGICRHNCLKYIGHGEEHSYDQQVIVKHNNAMYRVGIILAWMKHMEMEFGELW